MTANEKNANQRLLDSVSAISSDLSLPNVLERIVESGMSLVEARYGALGVLDDTGESLSDFIPIGMPEDQIAAIGDLPQGEGVLGVLIVEPSELRLADVADHPDAAGFPEGHPKMTTFLGAPILVAGEVFGNIYLCDKAGGEEFTAADQELIVGLASAAGVAIDNARLHERVSELLVAGDRERIARDLHDTVIQRIFASGLAIQSAAGNIADPQVAARLKEVVGDLDETVRQIRGTIFELQRSAHQGSSLRSEISSLVIEFSRELGFVPALELLGPLDSTVPPEIADQAMAVLREAITNVLRHAGAQAIDIEVAARNGELMVLVSDDGIGIADSADLGLGLANMVARAEDLHGSVEFPIPAGGGTTVKWHVPL